MLAEQPLEEGARQWRGMECLEAAQFLEAAICQLRQGISRLVITIVARGSPWQEGKWECEIGEKNGNSYIALRRLVFKEDVLLGRSGAFFDKASPSAGCPSLRLTRLMDVSNWLTASLYCMERVFRQEGVIFYCPDIFCVISWRYNDKSRDQGNFKETLIQSDNDLTSDFSFSLGPITATGL